MKMTRVGIGAGIGAAGNETNETGVAVVEEGAAKERDVRV
jgi:hypothetical protein